MASDIALTDLKSRLNIKTPGTDVELQDLLDAAVAEWSEWVGPPPDPVPANVRELILADVAGLYSSTQRGVRARPDLSGEGSEDGRTPMALFPRIRAYALARQKRQSAPLFWSA